jgi:hypothetical protein
LARSVEAVNPALQVRLLDEVGLSAGSPAVGSRRTQLAGRRWHATIDPG